MFLLLAIAPETLFTMNYIADKILSIKFLCSCVQGRQPVPSYSEKNSESRRQGAAASQKKGSGRRLDGILDGSRRARVGAPRLIGGLFSVILHTPRLKLTEV